MPAEYLGAAHTVELVGDENGWELHITTEQGSWVVNVHGATHQLIGVGRELDAYWAEGRTAAAEHERYRMGVDHDAYPADSPKRPAYHSTHADIWDAREKGTA